MNEYENLMDTDPQFTNKKDLITNWIENGHTKPVPDVINDINEFIPESMTEEMYTQY